MFTYVCLFQVHDTLRDIHSFPHDALPISEGIDAARRHPLRCPEALSSRPTALRRARVLVSSACWKGLQEDRKSTRLNSSHANISYAVFCLKKKKKQHKEDKQYEYSDTLT